MMYSNKTNILQLTALMQAWEITDVIVCPGSRNSPIVQTMKSAGLHLMSIVDERSAGFVALGKAQALAKPVAVCCTSGSAVANLYPAVAEAYYQHVPLLMITADRPEAWIGQNDGQTLPQPGIFGRMVRKQVQLVEGSDDESRWYNNRLINESMIAMKYHGGGPVQINVPVSRPLNEFTVESLPVERRIHYCPANNDGIDIIGDVIRDATKILIVVGQSNNFTAWPDMRPFVDAGCVIVSELPGNCPLCDEAVICNADDILYACRHGYPEALQPDVVISFGGDIVSKHLKRFVRQCTDAFQCIISPDGEVRDVFMHADLICEGSVEDVLRNVQKVLKPNTDAYRKSWISASCLQHDKQTEYLTNTKRKWSMMGIVGRALPADASVTLHLANSTVLRMAQLYHTRRLHVISNRGMNGIEGTLSTAVGYASSVESINLVIIGDLSFFYDMNVLRHASHLKNLRILLINNGCGELMHLLPQMNSADALDEWIAASHHTSAEGWARQIGFEYYQVHDYKSLDDALGRLLDNQAEHPVLVEAMTDEKTDEDIYLNYYKSLLQCTENGKQ